jgi:2-polyprenyl-6-methoxyphenol hydroxylase-like FAD-dependent oxidoreductase
MLMTVTTQLTPFRLQAAGDKHYQVDRRVLRSILLSSQEHHITYDSAFASYSITSEGVIAKFANGTTAIGSLLVGADGIKSKVAAQLIGDSAAPLDLGLRIIYGKTPLSPDVEGALHVTLRKGISFVTDKTVDGDKVTLVLETMRFPDASATENYIFWALTTRKGGFMSDDQRLLSLTGQQVADLSIQFTKHWDSSIRPVLEKQAVFETAILRVSSSDPDYPPTWDANSRVTVLGDAVHCMPPTGGQGANAAMYDAGLLGQILADSTRQETDGGGWDVETIGRYEEAMRYNIGDIVGLACVGAQHALGADTLEAMLAGVEGKKTQ